MSAHRASRLAACLGLAIALVAAAYFAASSSRDDRASAAPAAGRPVPGAQPAVTIAAYNKKAAGMPKFDKPVSFDTPEADAILAHVQVLPADNPFNEDVSTRPLHPDSKNLIANMNPGRHLYFNSDMGFLLVPPDQKRVPVKIVSYPDESDPGPFPVPDGALIEGWPWGFQDDPAMTLARLQREGEGDRHCILVDPVKGMLTEFFVMRRTDAGWQAAQASTFDLKTNALRPDGWTSSDAAGLPIFPAVVRYDECAAGMVAHALRVTVRRTRRACVYPATHFASRSNDANLPRMGERVRLKAGVDISGFSPFLQAILKGLKKYGAFVADNGIDWAISVAPDPRLAGKGLERMVELHGRDFEVVQPTAPNEGPRAPAH